MLSVKICIPLILTLWLTSKVIPEEIKASTTSQTKPLYENNFESVELDMVPDEFLVLNGVFAVKRESENNYLELPGTPLETFGVLFGPAENSGVGVSTRIYGTSRRRQFPTFAVGLNGVGGYRLQVSPAKRALEIYKIDQAKADVPYDWQSGTWTMLRLQVRKVKVGEWKVEGKAWPQGEPEPKKWTISLEEQQEPPPGRAGIWGCPFSGNPIRYDDLVVTAIDDK